MSSTTSSAPTENADGGTIALTRYRVRQLSLAGDAGAWLYDGQGDASAQQQRLLSDGPKGMLLLLERLKLITGDGADHYESTVIERALT